MTGILMSKGELCKNVSVARSIHILKWSLTILMKCIEQRILLGKPAQKYANEFEESAGTSDAKVEDHLANWLACGPWSSAPKLQATSATRPSRNGTKSISSCRDDPADALHERAGELQLPNLWQINTILYTASFRLIL